VRELDLDGVKGVVPFSETGLKDQGLMLRFVGQVVRVKVAGLDRENLVVA
jgi:small subunit ribosomal protein S1